MPTYQKAKMPKFARYRPEPGLESTGSSLLLNVTAHYAAEPEPSWKYMFVQRLWKSFWLTWSSSLLLLDLPQGAPYSDVVPCEIKLCPSFQLQCRSPVLLFSSLVLPILLHPCTCILPPPVLCQNVTLIVFSPSENSWNLFHCFLHLLRSDDTEENNCTLKSKLRVTSSL